jgi:hypothetical protein
VQAILLLTQLISIEDIAKDFEKALGKKIHTETKLSSVPLCIM